MTGPSYPAARTVAERIGIRLATSTIDFAAPAAAPKPDVVVIEEVISAAFWASLRREEGRAPKISLAFVPPEQVSRPLTFATRLGLQPEVLARLAPAVERPHIHLGVWWYDNQLCIWGTTRTVPTWCFVLEVVGPGLLVVKYRREEPSTKFANVAVLEGDSVKFIERGKPAPLEGPPSLRSLLTFYSSGGNDESDDILVRLSISMRAHGRGGSLLVVPRVNESWRSSIVQPIPYLAHPPFPEIDELHDDPESLHAAVDSLAGLTAVDGATIISDDFALLAFGVKIVARHNAPHLERIFLTEPIEGARETIVEPSQLGNTRHMSAAQFVYDQRDAISLVASQDGRFTVFAWSADRDIVHARRLESLLL